MKYKTNPGLIKTKRPEKQDLASFTMPQGFRGASAFKVQLWWLVQSTVFRLSPQFLYSFRASILRFFGAKVGHGCIIRPSATFTYPWKISLGDRVWIGDDVVLYSLGDISVGNDTVISQRCYVCAGDHDYAERSFPIRARPISIGSECWLATDTFVAPGVRISDKCVVGARSGVFSDLSESTICVGTPAKAIKSRGPTAST